MKMLDLFCGTKSMANAFTKNGYDVFTIDNNLQHNPDLCIDILDFHISMLPIKMWNLDVIHASPPCTTFSIASCGHHWNPDKTPKTKECEIGIALLNKTLRIINELNPIYWFIENPMGLMRKQPQIEALSKKYFHHTVTYCQYGDTRMKPTDWWTNCEYWHPKPRCHNGDSCHEAAPRGSKTGTQGLSNDVERSRIPDELCDEIVRACAL